MQTFGTEGLSALRREAQKERDPTASDETLALLIGECEAVGARRILEIGAGECLTSIALFLHTGAQITAIERDEGRILRARELLSRFRAQDAVCLIGGDAGGILPRLEGEYDVIFLDGPKVQYRRYFADCKRLLRQGGSLVADDVLLHGWVRGECPPKRHMLAAHLREYLRLVTEDPAFRTEIYEIGEGVAVSRKL